MNYSGVALERFRERVFRESRGNAYIPLREGETHDSLYDKYNVRKPRPKYINAANESRIQVLEKEIADIKAEFEKLKTAYKTKKKELKNLKTSPEEIVSARQQTQPESNNTFIQYTASRINF